MLISDWSADGWSSELTEVKGAARRAGCRGGLHAWVAGDRLRGWTRRRKRAVPTRTVWVLHDYGSLPRRDLDRSGRRRESCEKPLETLDILVQTPTNWCRTEEQTSELQSLRRISYAVFCSKKNSKLNTDKHTNADQ